MADNTVLAILILSLFSPLWAFALYGVIEAVSNGIANIVRAWRRQ
jgi:hypothetical protein